MKNNPEYDMWLENPGLRLNVSRNFGVFTLRIYDSESKEPQFVAKLASYRAKDLADWLLNEDRVMKLESMKGPA